MASISGGSKLEAAMARIVANAEKAAHVDIGFLAGATYPDGTSVPMVAALNEFGVPSKNQPPRPFFRDMIAAKSGEWGPAVAGLLKANYYDTKTTLGQTGKAIKGQLQQSITSFNRVPLAASTIERKGFDKQLIASEVMVNSADFRVD